MKKLLVLWSILAFSCAADVGDEAVDDEIEVDHKEEAATISPPMIMYLNGQPNYSGWGGGVTLNRVGAGNRSLGMFTNYTPTAAQVNVEGPTLCYSIVFIAGDNNGGWCDNGAGPDHRIWLQCPDTVTFGDGIKPGGMYGMGMSDSNVYQTLANWIPIQYHFPTTWTASSKLTPDTVVYAQPAPNVKLRCHYSTPGILLQAN